MPPPPANPWQDLFATEPGTGAPWMVECRVLHKNDRPWLLFPQDARLAREALALYPAQSAPARFAKAVLRLCLGLGFFPGAKRLKLRVEPSAPFARFLQTTVGMSAFPKLASLAGNPTTPGQRQIILLFGGAGHAQCVVKVGSGGRAAELIRAEATALRTFSGVSGVPALRAEFAAGPVRAFALDFCPGESPSLDDELAPQRLLTSWIQPQRTMRLLQLPALVRLQQLINQKPELSPLLENLADAVVHPVIMHGDFAPWNVKVSPRDRSWMVLDWERGEADGVPGWDWFHFVIQHELLVKRRPPEAIVIKLQTFLRSQPFQTYAAATKMVGFERALLRCYLAYSAHVIRPAEGRAATETMLALLAAS